MAKVQVLVIDDEDRLRDVVLAVLESAGYTTAGAASGDEALARFTEFQPDMIILDMMMPGVDGFEFLARLRGEPLKSTVPVLISSALGSTLAHAIEPGSAATLGIVGVLAKPVDIDALLGSVRTTIGPGINRTGGPGMAPQPPPRSPGPG
jgi:CheY-like chemotaxis protein